MVQDVTEFDSLRLKVFNECAHKMFVNVFLTPRIGIVANKIEAYIILVTLTRNLKI